jgi:hypothetical protein
VGVSGHGLRSRYEPGTTRIQSGGVDGVLVLVLVVVVLIVAVVVLVVVVVLYTWPYACSHQCDPVTVRVVSCSENG